MANRLLNAFASEDPERFALLLGSSENTEDTLTVLDSIPPDMGAEVATRMSIDTAERLLPQLADERLAGWLKAANIESGRRLLARVKEERITRLIEMVDDRGKRRQLKRLLGYPPKSVGTLSRFTMLTVPHVTTCLEISARLKAHQGRQGEPVAVLNDEGEVMGVLDLRSIIGCQDEDSTAGEFCIPLKPVFADAPLSSLVDPAAWERQASLPVVDYERKPVGYINRTAVEAASRGSSASSYYTSAAGELITRFWQFLSFLLVLMLDRRGRS